MSTRTQKRDDAGRKKLPRLERSKMGLGFVCLYFTRDLTKVEVMQLEEKVREICEE